MKTITLTLAAVLATLAAGCTQDSQTASVEEPPAAPAEPEPAEAQEAPTPEIRVSVSSGLIDWSSYERWMPEPPTLVLVERLDSSTKALLNQKVQLAEAVLSDAAPVDSADFSDAIDRLKNRAPGLVYTSYVGDRISAQQSVTESYARPWSGITATNLDSVVTRLERQYERDLEQYSRNASSTRAGRQAGANLAYVRRWASVFADARRLIVEMEKPTPPSEREKALAQWRDFQAQDLPILTRVVSENEVAEVEVAEDGSYQFEGRGELLIRFKTGKTELLYPKQGRHRFRFFNERTETESRTIEVTSE